MEGKFAPIYRNLQSAVEFLYGGNLDSCVTQNECLTFAEVAIQLCGTIYHTMACTGRSNAEEFLNGTYKWPNPLDEEAIEAFFVGYQVYLGDGGNCQLN